GTDPHLAGLSPGDLTVTIGVGPRLVGAIEPAGPGAATLPEFGHERLAAASSGGDLLVQLCASAPLVLPGALAAIVATGSGALTERWRQSAFRGPNVPVAAGAS